MSATNQTDHGKDMTVRITVNISIHREYCHETIPQAQHEREMRAMSGQVASVFRKLVSDIQKAVG